MNFDSLRSVAHLYTPADRDLRRNLLEQKKKDIINKQQQKHVEEILDTFAQNAAHQKNIWNLFVDSFTNETLEAAIAERTNLIIEDSEIRKEVLVLQTVWNLKNGKLDIEEHLVRRGVFGLLIADHEFPFKIHYLSDTIADGDIARAKIWNHYQVMADIYGTTISMDMLGSDFGASVQTGVQALQLIGSHSELESEYHNRSNYSRLSIFVNNASRRKHSGKELAEGSKCLWAKFLDKKTGMIHDIIGVDHDVFAPLYDGITAMYVIEGIPNNENYADLSRGTQFRSLNKFPYPQFLNAISGGGAPAGFEVRKVSKEDVIDPIVLEKDEMLLADRDKYLNGKCLCVHPDGIEGLAKSIGASLDKDPLMAEFVYNGKNVIEPMEFVPTLYLGKHGNQNCIWNGSSRGYHGEIFPEIGRSVGSDETLAEFIRSLPMGTKIKLKKK